MVNEINNRVVVTSPSSLTQPVPSVKEQSEGMQKPLSKSADEDADAVKSKSPAPVDNEQLEKAVEDLNQYVQTMGHELRFSVDKEIGSTIITVMDRETEQVIRQIPPEQAITLAKFLDQSDDFSSTGLLEEA